MAVKNLTQQELGAALDVSHRSVGNWLKGTLPHSTKLQQLADYFKLETEVLVDPAIPLPGTGGYYRQKEAAGTLTAEEQAAVAAATAPVMALRERARAQEIREMQMLFVPALPDAKEPWAMELSHPRLVADLWRHALMFPVGHGNGFSKFLERYRLAQDGFANSPEFNCLMQYYSHCRNVCQWIEDANNGRGGKQVAEWLDNERERDMGESWD
ncbi:MAG: helix-turn-helix transcriptional regulator [Verrucomicrobiota bacterium]|nr:helix-turn-helix transcriptional regulator [Verrucomicrobiota bacterium]